MKRKITELEQKLLENDYRLAGKHYSGKHSEKTDCYVYEHGNYSIKLDYTRTKVIDFALVGVLVGCVVDKTVLVVLNAKFKALNDFVASLLPQEKKSSLETLEIDIEPPLSNIKGKTFEQLDEENQEIESEK